MSTERTPSQELLAARRGLDTLRGVVLLSDWAWYESAGKWVLHCRLLPDVRAAGPIPLATDWYVLVAPAYPWGSIKFFPSKDNGITQTFPHQNYNDNGSKDLPWLSGDLCLNTSVHVLGRYGYDIEPYDVHKRLLWHFQRALAWLRAASDDALVLAGEPFELPQFPGTSDIAETVAFGEDAETFLQWQELPERYGLIELFRLRTKPDVLLTKTFRSIDGRELLAPTWGLALQSKSEHLLRGIWLRITGTPALQPWQAPLTWGELRHIFHAQNLDLDKFLKATCRLLRDGQEHVALLGFPIPVRVDDIPHLLHWQAFQLPILSRGTTTAHGFRTDEKGYWRRDRTQLLHNKSSVAWLASENWHIEQVSTRGRLPAEITSKKILLIGGGALGSPLAELLVRTGVQHLTIVDADWLQVGNLVRHTLGLDDLKTPKAAALAKRLNLASPHASVTFINADFPLLTEPERAHAQQCEVILDCTGHDEVLYHLDHFPWGNTKRFFSISMGFQARRLFCFTAYDTRFPHAVFRDALDPWLKKELEEYADEELPREGIGCWHPVFPARADDVWMMAAVAVKLIESVVAACPNAPVLNVFEQHFEHGVFAGIRRTVLGATDA